MRRPSHCCETSFAVSSKRIERISNTIHEFMYLERKKLKRIGIGKNKPKKNAFFCEIVYMVTVYTL